MEVAKGMRSTAKGVEEVTGGLQAVKRKRRDVKRTKKRSGRGMESLGDSKNYSKTKLQTVLILRIFRR